MMEKNAYTSLHPECLRSESNVVRMFWIKFRFGPSDYKWLDTNRETNENEGGSSTSKLTATHSSLCEKNSCLSMYCIYTRFCAAYFFYSLFIHKFIQLFWAISKGKKVAQVGIDLNRSRS